MSRALAFSLIALSLASCAGGATSTVPKRPPSGDIIAPPTFDEAEYEAADQAASDQR